MKILSTCDAIRDLSKQYKSDNEKIALVPTMGHLHAGHISLIELAKSKASKVIVSIFINPIQFNQSSDYEKYPRTTKNDIDILSRLNIDAVFTPPPEEIYPSGTNVIPKIYIPQLADILEGKHRPNHFEGVCTVVCKLFNIINPNIAVFGEKDYQQLLIIQRMTSDLDFDIEIVSGQTQREQNGLAMSSRNSLMSTEQQTLAAQIHNELQQVKAQFSTKNTQSLEEKATTSLEKNGFRVEYFSLRDADNLQAISQDSENVVILTAVWLGDTRLIDNLLFPMP